MMYVCNTPPFYSKVFAEAEEEYKEKGPDRAGLHVIIFDEVDALMRKRGSRLDSSGVMDSCVNQLLSKIDGLTANDNMCVRAGMPLGLSFFLSFCLSFCLPFLISFVPPSTSFRLAPPKAS